MYDCRNLSHLKDPSFYKLVKILKKSTPKELKKYLAIIKLIKGN